MVIKVIGFVSFFKFLKIIFGKWFFFDSFIVKGNKEI